MGTTTLASFGYLAIYVGLAGVASFLEKPASRGFGDFQLNTLIRAGSLAAAAVALIFVHGLSLPAGKYVLAGLGLGFLTGVGSFFYCFALDYMPVSLVVTLSNLYIVITIVLGIVALDEPITALKVVGLICIVGGVNVLTHTPARYAADPQGNAPPKQAQTRGFVIMAIYVVIVGVSAFLEKPALKGLQPTELNALMALAMTFVALTASAVKGPPIPTSKRSLGVLGVGVMIGAASVFYFLGLRGLPVSVAAATSNAYVIVTFVLSAIFLHQPLSRYKVAGIVLTLVGVTLLALSEG